MIILTEGVRLRCHGASMAKGKRPNRHGCWRRFIKEEGGEKYQSPSVQKEEAQNLQRGGTPIGGRLLKKDLLDDGRRAYLLLNGKKQRKKPLLSHPKDGLKADSARL